jgi:hypothetical protein
MCCKLTAAPNSGVIEATLWSKMVLEWRKHVLKERLVLQLDFGICICIAGSKTAICSTLSYSSFPVPETELSDVLTSLVINSGA